MESVEKGERGEGECRGERLRQFFMPFCRFKAGKKVKLRVCKVDIQFTGINNTIKGVINIDQHDDFCKTQNYQFSEL